METGEMQTKSCPQCGQLLFADMMVCYGCLHSFGREGTPAVGQAFAKLEAQPSGRSSRLARHLGEGGLIGVSTPEGGRGERVRSEDAADLVPAACGTSVSDTGPSDVMETTIGQEGDALPDLTSVLPSLPPSPSLALRVQTTAVDVVIPLPATGLSIGRAPGNDVILHSKAVSRHHLRIDPSPSGATMLDLGATNPALYQGRAAPSELALCEGDAIDICGTMVTLVGADMVNRLRAPA